MKFKDRVYKIVSRIPKGKVLTYGEVARLAGSPNASRAVGNLMAKNPDWPRIPCHRVIRSDGEIGNWSGKGGRNKKLRLLQKEGAI